MASRQKQEKLEEQIKELEHRLARLCDAAGSFLDTQDDVTEVSPELKALSEAFKTEIAKHSA
jgi:cell division septum initiation protein DivIVA